MKTKNAAPKVTQKFTKAESALGIVLLENWIPVPPSPVDPTFTEVPSERFLSDVPPGGGTWTLAIMRAGSAPFLVGSFQAPSQVGATRPVEANPAARVHYALIQIA
jgi:hypothetical protein